MKNRDLYIILFSFGSALLFTLLILWYIPGVNVLIYWLLIIVCFVLYLYLSDTEKVLKRSLPIIFLILPLSAISLYRTNDVYVAITAIILPFLFYLLASLKLKDLKRVGVVEILLLPLTIFISWFIDVVGFVKDLFKTRSLKKYNSRSSKDYVIGLIAAIPFFIIFLLLFTSADAIFNKYISDLFNNWNILELLENLFTNEDSFRVIFDALFTIVAFVYFLAVYHALFTRKSGLKRINQKIDQVKGKLKRNWSEKMLGVFLFPLNILFGLFVWVQIEYLFGGEKNIGGDFGVSLTYSEYARRGFMELLIVSFIVFLIIWFLQSKVDLKKKATDYWYKLNGILFLLFTFIISLSALSRMQLLTETYGFTNIRIFGWAVMFAITLLIPVVIYAIYSEKRFNWFNRTYAYFVLAGILTLTLLPTDLIIADQNIARYERTDQVDVKYLIGLSSEAQPKVAEFLLSEEVDPQVNATVDYIYSEIYSKYEKRDHNWQEYNISKARFINYLEDRYSSEVNTEEQFLGSLEQFLEDYTEVLKRGDYEGAFGGYWTDSSQMYELDNLKEIKVIDSEISPIGEPLDIITGSIGITANVPYQDLLMFPYQLTLEYEGVRYRCTDALVISLKADGYTIENDGNLMLGYPSYYYYETDIYSTVPFEELVFDNLQNNCEVVD